jgi:hypothetical protein
LKDYIGSRKKYLENLSAHFNSNPDIKKDLEKLKSCIDELENIQQKWDDLMKRGINDTDVSSILKNNIIKIEYELLSNIINQLYPLRINLP